MVRASATRSFVRRSYRHHCDTARRDGATTLWSVSGSCETIDGSDAPVLHGFGIAGMRFLRVSAILEQRLDSGKRIFGRNGNAVRTDRVCVDIACSRTTNQDRNIGDLAQR